jgi:NAD(P)-dependent dehydrogenase (short-subunit alcohol dehydrogenase family)
MESSLRDRVAVVTGSGRGIGRSIALALAEDGARVIVNMKKNLAEGEETLKQIKEHGGEGAIIQSDVSTAQGAKHLIDETIKIFGTIDILVNNAGVGIAKPISEVDENLWDKQINTNLKSVFFCSKYAAEIMCQKKYGRIINISSVAGLIGMADLSVYSTAKAGIFGMTKSFAAEFSDKGITINAIGAGLTKTKMGLSLVELISSQTQKAGVARKDFEEAWFRKHSLTGKMIEDSEIARMVRFLAADESSNMTGQVFVIDSGWSISEARNYLKPDP